MRGQWAFRLSVMLLLLLNTGSSWAQATAADSTPASPLDPAQTASTDSATARSVDVTAEALECAWEMARSAGFQTQLSTLGRVFHAWRPHLQSMDTNEMDYVRVSVYGRGTAKEFRWDVKAYTITGTAMITTHVYSPRPPSRDADRLRRSIEKTCTPKQK